jgi:Protein of Unknown function (DUF2784)
VKPPMLYARSADLVAITHAAFIAFLLVGGYAAWRFPRLVWVHILAVVFTAAIFAFGADTGPGSRAPLVVSAKTMREGGSSHSPSSALPSSSSSRFARINFANGENTARQSGRLGSPSAR